MTYSKAGVDVSEVENIHRALAHRLAKTFDFRKGRFGEVVTDIGHYAGVIDIGRGRVLTVHVDGVGSKVLVAQMMNRFDTVGIDCVAMCANDLVSIGSEPVSFVDYLALQKPDAQTVDELVKGIVKGAGLAGVAVVGGETAIMPDVIEGVDGKGFDLVGMAVGVARRSELVTGERLKVGDIVLGVESSGVHSNGLTLARKVLLSMYGVSGLVPVLGRTLGEELLEPTSIYVRPVLEVLKRCEVHGLAHITGGSFSKLLRIGRRADVGFSLDSMPEPLAIFKLIQTEGNVEEREMYRTFNMGVGFCVCLGEEEVDGATGIFEKHGFRAMIVGKVVKRPSVTVGKTLIS